MENFKTYKSDDLTVIIPTIEKRVALLKRLVSYLDSETKLKNLIIVWDSDSTQPEFYNITNIKITVITHIRNRGLSAARNTGVTNLQTRLGMFIDDDILPVVDFVEKTIKFHNTYTSLFDTALGKVTWKGTQYCNAVTEWLEKYGHWNIFSTTDEGSEMPEFFGGFTSFKSQAFQSIRFSEKFTKYGCEDLELGQRLFAAGGRQIYQPKILGKHYKRLSVNEYVNDCIGNGYSKYIFFTLWPNDYLFLSIMRSSLSFDLSPESYREFIVNIAKYEDDVSNAKVIEPMMSHLSNVAFILGFKKALLKDYPDIEINSENSYEKSLAHILVSNKKCKPALILLAVDYPENKLLHLYWREHKDSWLIVHAMIKTCKNNLNLAQELCDAALFIFSHASLKVKTEIQSVLSDFVNVNGLTINDENFYSQLDSQIHMSQRREAYFVAELSLNSGDIENAKSIAIDILKSQIAHVGAWLILANCYSSTKLKELFISRAKFYLQYRPKAEQASREKEIKILEGM